MSDTEQAKSADFVTENPWHTLRKFTSARIALGRCGVSVPTKHLLDFQLAHARAKDAVHAPLNIAQLLHDITQQAWPLPPPQVLHSRASSRDIYLQRPDYGRRLDDASREKIHTHVAKHPACRAADLAIVIADGLSATAIMQNAVMFLHYLFLMLEQRLPYWSIAPLCIVQQGRVAVGDEIAEYLQAKCLVVLIGERPGLSSPDSMGLYLTWAPEMGLSDARRNCISNIRPEGIGWRDAAAKALYLLSEAHSRKLSGVALKDRSGEEAVALTTSSDALENSI